MYKDKSDNWIRGEIPNDTPNQIQLRVEYRRLNQGVPPQGQVSTETLITKIMSMRNEKSRKIEDDLIPMGKDPTPTKQSPSTTRIVRGADPPEDPPASTDDGAAVPPSTVSSHLHGAGYQGVSFSCLKS